MAEKFTVAGKASFPLEEGGTVAPIDLGVDLTILNRADFSRNYTGSVTDDLVDFGTLDVAGAKAVLIKCKAGSCTVKFNGGSQAWPLAVGGYLLWANPSVPFPTAAAITTTGPASIIFIAVG